MVVGRAVSSRTTRSVLSKGSALSICRNRRLLQRGPKVVKDDRGAYGSAALCCLNCVYAVLRCVAKELPECVRR